MTLKQGRQSTHTESIFNIASDFVLNLLFSIHFEPSKIWAKQYLSMKTCNII